MQSQKMLPPNMTPNTATITTSAPLPILTLGDAPGDDEGEVVRVLVGV
jgi:hypothetical protein